MKQLLKLMLIPALGALMTVSCAQKEDPTPEKPVVTDEMYAVEADAETGVVVFTFKGANLNPYWTVVDPKGTKETFTDIQVTKTYEVNGVYTGSIVAFGQGGQSDPVEFSFTIALPEGAVLSETEKFLMSTNWRFYHYGWCSDGQVAESDAWDWEESSVPAEAADDILTFGKEGKFILNQGENTAVYNEDGNDPIKTVQLTGNDKWSYVKEGDVEYIQFSDGGFPGMLGDNAGINGKYEIRRITANSFYLYYDEPYNQQYIYFSFVPEDYTEPALTEEQVKAAVSGNTFYASSFGWWGEGWEYFQDPEALSEGDLITFKADGALVLSLGENNDIYNDGVTGGEIWTVTGEESWSVVSEGETVYIQFAGGGFPLMLAGQHVDEPDPMRHNGLNGKWTVTAIDEEGTVRLDYEQPFSNQWFTVFLSLD